MKRRSVVFDGDDTLWVTEPLYDAARGACADLVGRWGIDPGVWEVAQRSIDLDRVARLGLTYRRFPGSCVLAGDKSARALGRRLTAAQRAQLWMRGASVFANPAPLVPGAGELLQQLRPSFQLVLVTAGSAAVQRRRISQSGLKEFFDRRVVVLRKTPSTFMNAVQPALASDVISIGNSIPSDINTALRAGMSAIWLAGPSVWEHEHREELPGSFEGELYVANDLLEVPLFIEKWATPSLEGLAR